MTLKQAKKKWGIGETSLLNYISDGLINNISIVNNEIIIPDISKPLYVPKTAKRTAVNVYKNILKACDRGMYIDSLFMKNIGISREEFKAYINELVEKGILRKTDKYVDDYSNVGFILTMEGKNIATKCCKNSFQRALEAMNINPTISLVSLKRRAKHP